MNYFVKKKKRTADAYVRASKNIFKHSYSRRWMTESIKKRRILCASFLLKYEEFNILLDI
jgi:hypothetical protein